MKISKKPWLPLITPLLIIFVTLTIVGIVGKQLLQRNQELLENNLNLKLSVLPAKFK
jgi:CHASE1-domain containing sensor protein